MENRYSQRSKSLPKVILLDDAKAQSSEFVEMDITVAAFPRHCSVSLLIQGPQSIA